MSDAADLGATLVRALADLEAEGARIALVGGLAVGVRGRPRFTADIDIVALAETDADAERLVRAMVSRGYGLNATVENHRTGRLGAARLIAPGGPGILVELLFAACGIESEVVAGATRADLAGVAVSIASRGHLVAMKVLAMSEWRPDDRPDALALLGLADEVDLEVARKAVQQISALGYGGGTDLGAQLEALIRLAAPRGRHP